MGGTGFGSGATLTQSLDYNFGSRSFGMTSSLGAYASLGMFNTSANLSYTWGDGESWSWNINAGINAPWSDDEFGCGVSIGYGSDGWSINTGGYYNPHAWDDNPAYSPLDWNTEDVRYYNNCYSYALDEIIYGSNNGLQPGYLHRDYVSLYSMTVNDVMQAAIGDGRIKKPTLLNKLGFGKKGYYEVYLVVGDVRQGNKFLQRDYHWYRQDKGGLWSHKPGKSFVTRYDGNGALIKNPAKANHRSWFFYDGKLTSVNYNLGGVRLWVRR